MYEWVQELQANKRSISTMVVSIGHRLQEAGFFFFPKIRFSCPARSNLCVISRTCWASRCDPGSSYGSASQYPWVDHLSMAESERETCSRQKKEIKAGAFALLLPQTDAQTLLCFAHIPTGICMGGNEQDARKTWEQRRGKLVCEMIHTLLRGGGLESDELTLYLGDSRQIDQRQVQDLP